MSSNENMDMSRQERLEIYYTREEQKQKQVSGCPECLGSGAKHTVVRGKGLIKKEECTECHGDGYGCFCAICGEFSRHDDDELDFHHWDYEDNIGVLVCRDCHDSIHNSGSSFPSKNDNWRREAVKNALALLYKNNPEEVPGESSSEESWFENAVSCLNIPQTAKTPSMEEIVSSARQNAQGNENSTNSN